MKTDLKRCYKCKTDKNITEFYDDISRKDLLSSKCKDCSRTYKNLKQAVKTYKKCPKCKRNLEINNFYRNNGYGDGYQSRCIDCRTSSKREEWALTPSAEFTRKIMIKYGLTRSDYENLLQEQEGRCKICAELFSDVLLPKIDHSHLTGKVRGILCHSCNVGLGNFKDSIEVLESAKNYILASR